MCMTMISIMKHFSFNRYMVECECKRLYVATFQCLGFNRYMVECEFRKNERICQSRKVLIDTWWNVNLADVTAMKQAVEF